MLYYCDISKKNAEFAKAILDPESRYKNNIYVGNSLKKDFKMKFDVVIGNPPYQAPGKENKAKLWPQFIDLAFNNLCADGGIVALVTPKQWLVNGQWEKHFTPHQIINLNVDECKRYFENIHSSFSYFIVEKSKPTKGYNLTLGDGSSQFVTTAPLDGSEYMYSGLLGKLINNRKSFPMITSSGYNTSGFSQGKKTLSKVETKEHIHFVVHKISHQKGTTEGFYSSTLDKTTYGVPRVVVGLWLSDWKKERMTVSSELLTSQQFRHFPCETMEEAENLKTVLSSKLYTWILLNLVDGNSSKSKMSGSITNNAVSRFPLIDLTRSWSDDELYKHFNLTQEEINLIEQ